MQTTFTQVVSGALGLAGNWSNGLPGASDTAIIADIVGGGNLTCLLLKGTPTYIASCLNNADAVTAGSIQFTEGALASVLYSVPTAAAGQCTGTMHTLNEYGAVESGVTIHFRAKGSGTADGYAFDSTETTSTSNGAGVVSRLFPSGSVPYQWRRGTSGNWTDFTTAAADGATFDIFSGVGTP